MSNQTPPIKFEIYDGTQLVQTEVLADTTIKIGRLSSSHLKLTDDNISRMHAVVEVHGVDDVVILDLGSDSGTWVNGDRVRNRLRLSTGDRITIGRFNIVVTLPAKTQKSEPKPASRPAVKAHYSTRRTKAQASIGPLRFGHVGANGTDATHIVEDGVYTIGEKPTANHFALDSQLPESPFPLAEYRGGLMIVNVPEGVAGEVMLDGQVYALDELAAAGKLASGATPRSRSLKLPPKGRCRLKIGGQFFLVNSVPAPAKIGPVPLIHTIDPQFLRYLFVGMALHALVALILALYPADATGLDFDDWTLDDRFAEMMFDEEKERLEEQKNFQENEGRGHGRPRRGQASKAGKRTKKRPTAYGDQGSRGQQEY